MILEKVYDELYGMIEDLKKKVASISGGSTVTITPALLSGTKIADYEIDETEGSIYAPEYDFSMQNETILGKWIDGVSDVAMKVFDLESDVSVSNTAWTSSGVTIDGFQYLLCAIGTNTSRGAYPLMASQAAAGSDAINLLSCRDGNAVVVRYLTLIYVKAAPTRSTKKKK